MAKEDTANRSGLRTGQVSELTVIAPLREGGAARLREKLSANGGSMAGADAVGTLHDMRWVFLNSDSTMLFATTFDGDWDAYIDDFAAKIPDLMDFLFSEVAGWPGIKNPAVKDFIADHQITATAWYSAYPDQRVSDIRRNAKIAKAFNALLDSVSE